MGAEPPLPVRVLDSVVRVLKGLVPVEAGFPGLGPRSPVLEATVVLAVGSVALWGDIRGATKSEMVVKTKGLTTKFGLSLEVVIHDIKTRAGE